MPKDDYLKARNRQRGERERRRLDREQVNQHEINVAKFLERKQQNNDFPAHELIEQPDGSLLSPVYKFDQSRWARS